MTDKQLLSKEARLRKSLSKAIAEGRRESKTYALAYSRWFALREEGLSRKLYKFFIPSEGDQV